VPVPASAIPYHPRFADAQTILFAADPGGLLSLYRYDLGTEELSLVARDPVAVIGGVQTGAGYVVSAYTADGLALRAIPEAGRAEAIAASTQPPIPIGELGPEIQGDTRPDASELDDRRYLAAPLPRFWLPAVTIAGTDLELESAGFGATVYGADYLGRHQVQLGAYYFPWLTEASWDLLWSSRLGRFGIQLQHAAPVTVDAVGDTASRGFNTNIGLSADVLSRFRLGVSNRVEILTAFGHGWEDLTGHRISIATGAGWSRTPASPAEAFYAPGSLSAQATVGLPLQGPSFAFAGVRGNVSSAAALGLGRSNHAVVIRPAVNWATSPALLARSGVAGFAATEQSPVDDPLASALLGLEFRSRRFLMDVPVFPNSGITSVSYAVMVEGAAVASSSQAAIEPELGITAELTTGVAFLTEIPVSLGVRLRLPLDGSAFDPGRDLRLYLSTDILESIPTLP
jgi:hypothetical protein